MVVRLLVYPGACGQLPARHYEAIMCPVCEYGKRCYSSTSGQQQVTGLVTALCAATWSPDPVTTTEVNQGYVMLLTPTGGTHRYTCKVSRPHIHPDVYKPAYYLHHGLPYGCTGLVIPMPASHNLGLRSTLSMYI